MSDGRLVYIFSMNQQHMEGGNRKNAYFISVGNIAMWLYPAELETSSILLKEKRQKEIKNRFLELSCDTPHYDTLH